MLYSVLVVSVLGHTTYYGLIQRYEANLIAPLTLMSPLMTIVLGIWLTGDHFDMRMAFGAALALVGVFIIAVRPNVTLGTTDAFPQPHLNGPYDCRKWKIDQSIARPPIRRFPATSNTSLARNDVRPRFRPDHADLRHLGDEQRHQQDHRQRARRAAALLCGGARGSDRRRSGAMAAADAETGLAHHSGRAC